MTVTAIERAQPAGPGTAVQIRLGLQRHHHSGDREGG